MPANATPFSWATESQVTLCRVAWDDSYKDVVSFSSPEARDAYFASLQSDSIKLTDYTYLKPNEPINVDVPFHRAYTYNYLYVDNPKTDAPDDVTPPRFYYFITGAAMVNPSNTALTVQLDVFQTYLWQFQLGMCFVERGHQAVAAAYNRIKDRYDRSISWSLRTFCAAPEGLDVGNEYIVGEMDYFDLSANDWAVIVQSNTDLAADWGTRENPSLKTADGQMTDGLASGCNVYAIDSWNYSNFMKKVRDAPWVAKGIVSISAFPKTILTDGPTVSLNGIEAHFLGDTPDQGHYYEAKERWYDQLTSHRNPDYQYLVKMATFPYAYVELVNFQGNSLILKPELITDDNLVLDQMSCAAPPFQKVAFYPANYGNWIAGEPDRTSSYSTMDYNGELYQHKERAVKAGNWLDSALWFQSFPQMSIVNDEYVNYLASTVHGRNYSYQSAGWAQSKSLAGSQLTYDQASQQLATNQANQDLANQQAIVNAALGAAGQVTSGIMGGGALGLAASVPGTVFGLAGAATNYMTTNQQFQNNQAQASQFAYQNKELAQWASRGDYQNAIAGINATVQDAALTQPSQSGQMSGDGFNLSNGMMIVQIRYRVMDNQMQEIVGNYFLKYGYAMREYMVPPADFMCMNRFTYWKMLDTSIICSAADEGVKNAIRGIFEKGVTVWRSPADIGRTYGADNAPLSGIYGYDRTVSN